MMLHAARFVFLIAGLVLPTTALARSQATTGIIEGVVSDPDGGPIPGATVTVTNTDTGFTRTVFSQRNGRFYAPLLPLGPYTLTVTVDGFAEFNREGLRVSVGQRVDIDVSLELASVQETVTVVAQTPLIETTSSNRSMTVDERAIEGLPNNGRNFLDFTLLTPGVAIAQGPDGDVLTINGQKGIQNNISVDGNDFNNPFFGEQRGGQRPPFTFNLDAVQEVVVVANGANAEFGRSSGGFVQVVTKSGTNRLQGSAHVFFTDDALTAAAKLPDGSNEPDFSGDRAQVGFTLGGPIERNESFWFIAGDFQAANTTKQTDPGRIEQRVVDFLASIGMPNENGSIERTDDARALLGKVDFAVGDRHQATVRYNHTWSEQKNGTFDVNSWGVSANAIERDFSNAASFQLNSAWDRIYNEFRFQWAREDRPRTYEGPTNPATGRPFPDTAFDFANQYRFGLPFFIPVEYHDTRWQFTDNVSIVTGDHSIKAGAEFNRTNANQTFIGFANGRVIYNSTDGFINHASNPNYVECSDGTSNTTGSCPGGAIVGPVLLYVQQAGVGGLSVEEAGTQDITQKELAVFVQDSWQVSPRVLLDVGLRWEAQIQPPLITPVPELFYFPFIGQTREGQEFPADGTMPSDWTMFQPRFGLAYDMTGDGRRLLRLSAGVFNARIPGLNLASSRSTDGSRGQTLFRNSALTDILGPVPAYSELLEPPDSVPFFPGVFVFDKDFQNPDTYSASATFEQVLGRDYVAELTGAYAKTTHITRFTDQNDPLLGSVWSTGLEPDSINGIGTLTTVESTAKSEYFGLTFAARKRYSDRWGFQLNYTLGFDKSDDDNERDPFTFRYAKITDLDAEWSWSDRDQRHRANFYVVTLLPGDVNFNSRFSYRSATPVSLTETGEIAATPSARINADGSVTQRNMGRKDNKFLSLDVRVSKFFTFGSNRVEVIFEAFNVLNNDNFIAPQTTNLVFNFDGTIRSGAGNPRVAQLGLKYVF